MKEERRGQFIIAPPQGLMAINGEGRGRGSGERGRGRREGGETNDFFFFHQRPIMEAVIKHGFEGREKGV